MADLNETFWNRMPDCRAGMLSAKDAPAVPMSHYVDAESRALWFITANGTDLARSAQTATPAQYTVMNDDAKLYARIDGTLSTVTDPAKLEELWSVFASVWFEDGKRDPDVQLLRMDLSAAEIWATNGKLSFFYEVAKSSLIDGQPDIGEHGTVSFI